MTKGKHKRETGVGVFRGAAGNPVERSMIDREGTTCRPWGKNDTSSSPTAEEHIDNGGAAVGVIIVSDLFDDGHSSLVVIYREISSDDWSP